MNKVLIFDLASGFNDMVFDLAYIKYFMDKNLNFNYTIRNCSCRRQNDPTIFLWIKPYEVDNLFDDETFSTYKNYVRYSEIKEKSTEENTYDLSKYKKFYVDEDYKSDDLLETINNCDKKNIILGTGIKFYINKFNDCGPIWKNINKAFYKTLIPSKKILTEYNRIKEQIKEPYNFIHYRYEEDMKNQAVRLNGDYYTPTLDTLIDANLFKNNNLKIYFATSEIEKFHEKGLLNKPLESYSNILYKKSNLEYFDENAFVDFLIGMEAEEVFGVSYSAFSKFINKFNNTSNFYDKIKFE